METNKSKVLFKKRYDKSYTFVIQRVADGQFKNLWKLEVKTPTDTEFIEVCDADSLSTCIAKVGYVFEQDGL
jgi:hypothetical protein